MVLAFVVPTRHAAAWLGILMIAGNPSLRIFSMLYLLPGLLVVRTEIALLAALLVASYFPPAIWLAGGLVTAALALGGRRPWLMTPRPPPGVPPARSFVPAGVRPARC